MSPPLSPPPLTPWSLSLSRPHTGPLVLEEKAQPPAYTAAPPTVVYQPTVVSAAPPDDQLVMSLFTTFCCFWPLGMFAIIKSIEVRASRGRVFSQSQYFSHLQMVDNCRARLVSDLDTAPEQKIISKGQEFAVDETLQYLGGSGGMPLPPQENVECQAFRD